MISEVCLSIFSTSNPQASSPLFQADIASWGVSKGFVSAKQFKQDITNPQPIEGNSLSPE
ncbi:hypothetical protein LEP1GSC185_0962 [Leptospira licerasiae serovar Varillal str. VAR 010]|uniref:Uncharacterized protein n=1 Tax=Leptospira licerasiae str. MMD4847 TaxID=1049971 RepID=A0ABN0HD73_9LEPT|nr:hypothetical protein LEP1GSC185_0962 [Leptospira licerasiae serovar Varillal str. VAR 010]EJZ43276.1 hypothetical protein LEP1GSC178_3581 [Leptospira licerasiae str. MMD4847]